jgi:hypothetical protein
VEHGAQRNRLALLRVTSAAGGQARQGLSACKDTPASQHDVLVLALRHAAAKAGVTVAQLDERAEDI